MAQQTAIEWFMNQINQYTELEINHADGSKTKTRVIPPWIMQNLIEQAKQMEKEQIENAYNAGSKEIEQDRDNAAWYYFEKYGKLLK